MAEQIELKVFERSDGFTDKQTHYCPGCTHGIIHRLVAEVLTELGVLGKTIGVASVGCSALNYDYFNFDMVSAAHGRAPAVATGIKRVRPENVVFTYQGDGDLASIGTAEAIHVAHRGEHITTIFVNNAIYGMTGGQMAPTTMVGQKTTTSVDGRNPQTTGYPLKMAEIFGLIPGAYYVERCSVHTPKHVLQAKKAIKKAFEYQLAGKGFSIIEFVSTCPVGWKQTPQEALDWLEETMIPYYPLGVVKDGGKDNA